MFFLWLPFILSWAYTGGMAIFSVASAALGICLIGGFNPYALIPPMPYWCGALLAVSLLALSVLTAAGSVYCANFILRLMRAYGRSCRRQPASIPVKTPLPVIAAYPKLSAKQNFRLRKASLTALIVFAICFISGFAVCAISAGGLGFWHQWNWFV
jgi:hypothetical protein